MAVTPRFRMVAGPNGSGKTTLWRWRAQTRGFRTYLYFVATDNPAINVGRVRQRAKAGGHDVPVEKIVDRYHRSLGQITSALPWVSRAYFFDNSGNTMRFLAKYCEGTDLLLAVPRETVPGWFRSCVLETTQDGGGR